MSVAVAAAITVYVTKDQFTGNWSTHIASVFETALAETRSASTRALASRRVATAERVASSVTTSPRVTPVAPQSTSMPVTPTVSGTPTALPDQHEGERAKATTWVNVRSDRTRNASVVAVLNPDDVVQLGEREAGWRKVTVGGATGWVDPRHFDIARQ